MKKFTFLSLILANCLFLTSCASLLNGKQQTVPIYTNSEDSKVYLNDKLEGEGKVVNSVLERNAQTQQIRIEREGFKVQNFVAFQDKKSPLYIMSWVPFGILLYPPLYDAGPKSFDYQKELHLKKPDQKILYRTDQEKFISIQKTSFNLDEDDFLVKTIKGKNYIKGKDKVKEMDSNSEKIEIDNSIFSNSLNELLVKYNYTDTTGTILKKKKNSLYINASVENVEFLNIYNWAAKRNHYYLTSVVAIDWELTDIYGQPLYTKTTEGNSGEFLFSNVDENAPVFNCLDDAITSSFLHFINDPELRKFMNIEEEKEIIHDLITLNRAKSPSEVSEALEASVTIETNLGHGSGLVVSSDGYIITNLHVVANAEKINIFSKDGSTLQAKVIRQNEYKDLALLKVQKEFPYSFTINKIKNYNVGDDIYAIGTPNSVELGQSISRGIISGERNNEDEYFIQTDASVNTGNSGGPLINRKGELLGIINSKLSGIGIEGIGFAIPGFEIENALFIH